MGRRTVVRRALIAVALGAAALGAFVWWFGYGAWLEGRLAERPPALRSPPLRVEEVCAGLEVPWGLAFPGDGRILVTERPGRLRVVRNGKLDPAPVPGVPPVAAAGQGGLMDVVLHPRFAENGWLYLSYTAEAQGEPRTHVSRFRLAPEGLVDARVVFPGVPGSGKKKHFGCRLCFGRDGKLYLTLGERGEPARAQDLGDLNGKTLRLNDDGSVPEDNPFVGRADARPEIFSFGHRNAQGMAVQPSTGLLFQTEHGPSWYDAPGGGDEVNVVTAGANYGWPLIHHRMTRAGMRAPLLETTPAGAPGGACFYDGAAFPEWRGDLFFANLKGRSLARVKLEGRAVAGEEILFAGAYGRLRDVEAGPDGFLYFVSSNAEYGVRDGGDRLYRVLPR